MNDFGGEPNPEKRISRSGLKAILYVLGFEDITEYRNFLSGLKNQGRLDSHLERISETHAGNEKLLKLVQSQVSGIKNQSQE